MKLIYCPHCEDIIRLMMWERQCICGASKGRYVDENNVKITEAAIPIGVDTDQFKDALEQPKEKSRNINAWFFQSGWDTIRTVFGKTL